MKIIPIILMCILNTGLSYAQTNTKQSAPSQQSSNNYCSISLANSPMLVARKEGGINILAADSDIGIGNSAVINISYTGTPTLTLSSVTSISKTSGSNQNPTISKIITSGKFDNSDNNAKFQSVGGGDFTSGNKSIQLVNKSTNNQYVSDTLRVKIKAESQKPFPTGNYNSNIHISCD